MLELRIQKRHNWTWIYVGGFLFLVSLSVLIGKGPRWAFVVSGGGVLIAVLTGLMAIKLPDRYPSVSFSCLVCVLHILLISAAGVLKTLFLTPLSDEALKIPRFETFYSDPAGIFTIYGPTQWDSVIIASAHQSGVRFRPVSRKQYMGVSEVQIVVQKLDKWPESETSFLEKMAVSFSQEHRPPGKKAFELETEPAQLLGGRKGVWSILNVKKFWIPLRQTSLFGIKNGQYFCSISATGLKSHSTLSKVLCLGLFEKLTIAAPSSNGTF